MRNPSAASTIKGIHPSVLIGVAVVVLTMMGWMILFSSTLNVRNDPYFFIKRQLIWSAVALVAGVAVFLVNLEWLRKFIWPLVVVSIMAQFLVFVPGLGVEANGASRWIDLGPMRFQVSELAKLGIIFGLAHYIATQVRYIGTFWRGFIIPMGLVGVFCALIILQPDFGTTAVCGVVGAAMLFVAGVRWLYLIPAGIAALAGFSVMVWLDPIRLNRVVHFLDAEGNKGDGTYQLWQGMLAFVSGGIWGVGPGNGRQQLSYLPEAHTDFIFPIIGEEYGLVATIPVLLIFLMVFLVMVYYMPRCQNLYQSMLFLGAGLFITLQAVINVGVVTGCLPTKGLSLPFISYGGSNLVFMFILAGIMMNIMRKPDSLKWKDRPRALEEITG